MVALTTELLTLSCSTVVQSNLPNPVTIGPVIFGLKEVAAIQIILINWSTELFNMIDHNHLEISL